jgi:ribosomal protein S18 acetylase RimI-like enzyme
LDNPGRVINLKSEGSFIAQYVELRNKYCDLLLTESVNIEETKKWIKSENVEVVGVVKGDALLGAAILYLHRAGEIAFFVRTPNHGTGSNLLKLLERIARDRGIVNMWAWVLEENIAAQRTFIKAGYALEKESSKYFERRLRKGVVFRKTVSLDEE